MSSLFMVRMFHQILLNHQCINFDKHLFAKINWTYWYHGEKMWMYWQISSLKFHLTFFGSFYCKLNIFIVLKIVFNVCMFKTTIFVFNSTHLYFYYLVHFLHLTLWIPSARLLTRFDNDLAINIALSISY